ncbi:MAG: hypothetical protein WA051_01600 [Minisyncoccia bacterium]
MPTITLEVSDKHVQLYELPGRVVEAEICGTTCEPWFVIKNRNGKEHRLNGRDLPEAKILKS